jgi:hypothetical protein
MRGGWWCFWLLALTAIWPAALAADGGGDDDDDDDDGTQVEYLPEEPDAPPPQDSQPPPLRFEATLGALLTVPFSGQPSGTGFGFATTYGVGWGWLPIMIGLDFMSASASSSSNFQAPGDTDPIDVHKEAESRTLYFDAWLRVRPRDWAVRPYVEGFAGARLTSVKYSLASQEQMMDASSGSDEEWSSSLGYGGGVDFAGLLHIGETVSLSLGVRRLHGQRAKFTLSGSVAGQQVSTKQDVAGSVTMFMLGIVAWFDLGGPSS